MLNKTTKRDNPWSPREILSKTNQLASSPEVSQFQLVKEMLQAHINLLIQHNLYVAEIEKDLINNEKEIENYLRQILGFSITISKDKFRTEYLPILKEVLNAKTKTLFKLLLMAMHKNQDVAISFLDLALEREILLAEHHASMMKWLTLTTEEKILVALHNVGFLKSIKKQLQMILPDDHEKLTSIIKIKSHIKDQSSSLIINISVTYNWDELVSTFSSQEKSTTRKTNAYNRRPKNNSETPTNSLTPELFSEKIIKRGGEEVSLAEKQAILDAAQGLEKIIYPIKKMREKNIQSTHQKPEGDRGSIAVYELMHENVICFYSCISKLNPPYIQFINYR